MGSTSFRNVSKLVASYTASHPKEYSLQFKVYSDTGPEQVKIIPPPNEHVPLFTASHHGRH
jgi:hypothetical protein